MTIPGMIPIIDAHLDLAWSALFWNRDLTLPLEEMNAREAHVTDHRARGRATVSLPEMRRGNVLLCLGTLLARAADKRPAESFRRRDLDYVNQAHACAIAQSQLAYYRLLEEQGEIRVITTAAQLREHWKSQGKLGVIVAMEGADPIVSVSQLDFWFSAGLRVIGLAHYGPSAYGHGTGCDGPLTPAGVELLSAMSRLGMILDLTHSCDRSFFQAIDLFGGPVLASHNNARTLVPNERQYSDEQIKLLIQRNAVIGVVLDAWMLHPNWKVGETDRSVLDLDSVVRQIDHIAQLAGNTDNIGIGSDLDGGFGTEETPTGLDSIADLQKLAPLLAKRGYSEQDINKISHGNWLRFFLKHLPR